jgi:hypothetical protein
VSASSRRFNCQTANLSFRHSGARPLGREPGIHSPQRCGVWIPGSLAPLAPRNDGENTATRNRPCSLRRRVRRRPISSLEQGVRGSRPPQKSEGMARREDASGSSIAHLPFGKMRRLSARHRGVITATGRAFGNRLRGVRPLSEHDPFRAAVPSSLERAVRPAISQLLAGGPGGAPSPPERVACEATPAGAASLLHHQDAS